MLKNYFQIAYRNFFKNKVFSIINILGLAVGMAVAILIGLWIWDEMSFNHYHSNHKRLGEIVSIETFNGVTNSEEYSSVPIAAALRNNYSDEIKEVSVTKLVFISCLIASPIAWYYLHKWLQQYDFRITISYWVFIIVGAGTLVIALLTISIQIPKAALKNPVDQLRAE